MIIETKSVSFGATFDSTGYFSASHITSNIEQFCTAAIASSVETVVSPIFRFGSLMILRSRSPSLGLLITQR